MRAQDSVMSAVAVSKAGHRELCQSTFPHRSPLVTQKPLQEKEVTMKNKYIEENVKKSVRNSYYTRKITAMPLFPKCV